MSFPIDKNVPLPVHRIRCGEKKYPFAEMEVGHSFFVACAPDDITAMRKRVGMAAWCWAREHKVGETVQRFTTRQITPETSRGIGENGVRCWRIE